MEERILNCKKCGWEHFRVTPYGHLDHNITTYRVSCPRCGYCTKEKDTREEAIGAWNQRNYRVEKVKLEEGVDAKEFLEKYRIVDSSQLPTT